MFSEKRIGVVRNINSQVSLTGDFFSNFDKGQLAIGSTEMLELIYEYENLISLLLKLLYIWIKAQACFVLFSNANSRSYLSARSRRIFILCVLLA